MKATLLAALLLDTVTKSSLRENSIFNTMITENVFYRWACLFFSF